MRGQFFQLLGACNEEKPGLPAWIEWLQIKKQLEAPKSGLEEGGYGFPTFSVH
jgi:hypothetical protein